MNARERLLRVLRKEPVDRAPFICPGGMMSMAVSEVMDWTGDSWPEAHIHPAKMARLTAGVHRLGGVENVGVPFCMTVEAEGLGAKVDLGSRESEPKVVEYAIEELGQAGDLPTFSADKGRAKVCVEASRALKGDLPEVPVIANLTGPVSLATSLIDPLVYYRAMRLDKVRVHRLNRLATAAASAFGDALVEAGADVVCVADPSATGEIVGPAAFEELVLPYLNELVGHFHDRGTPLIVHICGDVKALGRGLAAVDADVISVDSMVDLGLLRAQLDGQLVMGNVSTYLLEQGSPARVLQAARSRLKRGVDILAPACGISPRTPVANIRSLFEAVAGKAECLERPAGKAAVPGSQIEALTGEEEGV